MRSTGLLFFVLISALAVGSAAYATNEEFALQVREAENAFARTMAARDLGSFESYVADDAIFFGRQTVLRGKAAVVAGWEAFFEGEKAPFSWEPERVEVLDSGTLALSSGPVRDPEGREIGTFNSVWRREEDGRWRVVFDKGCPPCDPGEPAEDIQPSPGARAACEQIYQAVLALPGTIVERREGTFYDDFVERDIVGCMIVVSGVWSELAGRSSPGDSIFRFLSEHDWVQEVRYVADGPDGTFLTLSKGDVWCFVRGQWDGGDDADSTYVPGDAYQFIVICTQFEGNAPAEDQDE